MNKIETITFPAARRLDGQPHQVGEKGIVLDLQYRHPLQGPEGKGSWGQEAGAVPAGAQVPVQGHPCLLYTSRCV